MNWTITDEHGNTFNLTIRVDKDQIAAYITNSRRRNSVFRRAVRDGKAQGKLCKGGVTYEISHSPSVEKPKKVLS